MRRTLFSLIIGLGGAAILISLGVWQVQRLAWKESIIADIEARIAAPAVALPAQPDRIADAYLPVKVDGRAESGALHVLVSQKQVGAGYRVIAPFRTGADRLILADLGFVAAADKDAVAPAGPAQLTGNLQWPQEVDGFTPAPDRGSNIWFARDVAQMAEALGTEPVMLVVRDAEPGFEGVSPLPLDTAAIPNDHLQYAITWFSLAALWLAMTFAFLRRRRAPNAES
jgi:surfeit locus 1 family protein